MHKKEIDVHNLQQKEIDVYNLTFNRSILEPNLAYSNISWNKYSERFDYFNVSNSWKLYKSSSKINLIENNKQQVQ